MATRNDVVGTLFVRLEPVSQGFAQSVQAVIDKAEKTTKFKIGQPDTTNITRSVSDVAEKARVQLTSINKNIGNIFKLPPSVKVFDDIGKKIIPGLTRITDAEANKIQRNLSKAFTPSPNSVKVFNDLGNRAILGLTQISAKEAEKINKNLSSAFNIKSQDNVINLNTKPAQQGISAINAGLINAAAQAVVFEEAIRRIGSTIKGTVTAFGDLFDTITRARIGFEQILGQTGGEALLQDVRELARLTPFDNSSLIGYSQQLIGVGVQAEKLIPLLTNVGDLVFSFGGGQQQIDRILYVLSQVQSAGRLIGQDALQFQNSLIPITKIIADYLKISQAEVRELQRQGQISSETVFAALEQAGQAVQGAMLKANQTVSGSLEILKGTIENFLVDQPVLTRIYEDIAKAINSITALFESPEFDTQVDSFFSSFEKVYNQLQPFIQGLTGGGSQLALQFLDHLTSTLEIISGVLSVFPEGVLTALGQFFVATAVLKAPIVLLGYAKSLLGISNTLASGQLVSRMTALTTASATQAAAVTANTNAWQRFNTTIKSMNLTSVSTGVKGMIKDWSKLQVAIQAAGAAALLVGSQLQTSSNDTASAIGGALSGAGLGATIGASFGPQGAAIGAAGGAIVGGITAMFNNAREQAEAFKAEMIERGKEIAEEFSRELQLVAGDPTSEKGLDTFFNRIQETQSFIDSLKEGLFNAETELLNLQVAYDNLSIGEKLTPDIAGPLKDQINNAKANVQSFKDVIEHNRGLITSLFEGPDGQEIAPFLAKVSTSLRLVNSEVDILSQAKFDERGLIGGLDKARLLAILTGEEAVDTNAEFDALNILLQQFDLTVADVGSAESLEPLIQAFQTEIPDALSEALTSINAFNEGLDLAGEGAKTNIGAMITQFQAFQNVLDSQQTVNESFGKFFAVDENNVISQLEPTVQRISDAGGAILDAASARFNLAFAQTFQRTGDKAAATAAAVEAQNTTITASFAALQSQLGLTDDAFRQFLLSAGLLEQYEAAVTAAGEATTQSFEEAANSLGITQERLQEIVGIQGDIDPLTQIVVTADVSDALTSLQLIEEALDKIPDNFLFDPLRDSLQKMADAAQQILNDNIQVFDPSINEKDQDKRNKKLQEAAEKINDTFADQAAKLADILAPEDTRALAEQAASARAESERLSAEAQAQLDVLQSLINKGFTDEAGQKIVEKQQELVNDILSEAASARSNAESLTDQAKSEAERLQREAEQQHEEFLRQLEQANDGLANAIESAADQIESAAKEWVGAITERTQFERAVGVGTATRNANRQADQINQLNAGLDNLIARGVSNAVIEALDINNVNDLRQVNRLVGSTDAELAALTAAVGRRDQAALNLAQEREQETAKRTITAAILSAFEILGVEEAGQARALIENLTITPDMDPNALAAQIIALITTNTVVR